MQTKSFDKFKGEVEVDETYIGGKVRNMHKAKQQRARAAGRWAGKVAVLGLLERHGANGSTIRMRIVSGTKRRELFGIMKEEVEPRTQVMTDALPSYASMNHVFVHKFCDHAESYARGNVHTNGLENFWSLLKRSITGTYIAVEPFHMFRYLDEQAYRFNTRKQSDGSRFVDVTKRVTGRRLTYKALTGHLDETGRTQ